MTLLGCFFKWRDRWWYGVPPAHSYPLASGTNRDNWMAPVQTSSNPVDISVGGQENVGHTGYRGDHGGGNGAGQVGDGGGGGGEYGGGSYGGGDYGGGDYGGGDYGGGGDGGGGDGGGGGGD
ncbi:hypothetical protein D9757_004412 [Collybiopsis confluens]|uniref:Uncharacterized protein n=1 Tax=Collybiopsis confluens TaxID=2823264 RepID=A0A8H5HWR9_9AGAR|nr:hypothetical protein D9757_004412 [Collybiopsis confluens]